MTKKDRTQIKDKVKTLTLFFWISLPFIFCIAMFMGMIRHGDTNQSIVNLYAVDPPSGTCYVDVLIKMTSDDEYYTDFNEPPKIRTDNLDKVEFEYLLINADSEIAKYNQDGYMSASIHLIDANMEKYEFQSNAEPCSSLYFDNNNIDSEWLDKKYREAKIAYVDEKGNILGVSGKSKKDWDWDKGYAFVADGKKLTYVIWGHSPCQLAIIIFGVIGAPLLFVLIPVVGIIMMIVRKRKSSKQKG